MHYNQCWTCIYFEDGWCYKHRKNVDADQYKCKDFEQERWL